MEDKDYVSVEVSKLLKKIGYKGIEYTWMNAPLLYSAQKWLRNEFNIHITIFSKSQESWMYRITLKGQSLEDGIYGEDFSSYEEALNDGIKESINLIIMHN